MDSSHAGPRKRGCRGGTGARSRLLQKAQREKAGKANVAHDLFFKTKLCAFWQAGLCQRADQCKYAHGEAELLEEPDLSKTSFCRKMLSGEQCHDPSCTFAHSRTELRSTSDFFKTALCPFDRGPGRCKLGKFCRFAHAASELRQKPLAAGLYDDSLGAIEHADAEDSEDELETRDFIFERSATMPPVLEAQMPRTASNGSSSASADEEAWVTDDEDIFDFGGWERMQTGPAACADSGTPDISTWKSYDSQASTSSSLPWLRQTSSGSNCSSSVDMPLQPSVEGGYLKSLTYQSQCFSPPMASCAAGTPGAGMAAPVEPTSMEPPPQASMTSVHIAPPFVGVQVQNPILANMVPMPVIMMPYPVLISNTEPGQTKADRRTRW
eukprot:TRINITY_DN8309_c0_g1_i1.p1 TRINITY_DN8309_c0_g1~~TRINITY_DN8309_c0_g1_i1.p1  ORF type:complete len:382 (-),score=81.32 TRINITY_DN8309_c0_g1_i1:105-1250(-)